MSGHPWWKGGVVYQIYPRSFADANGDGIGDLEGIRRHLDQVVWLGVDAVWISPFYPSPMRDGGYDISDHCGVDPTFGTLDDFDRLLADCHQRGLKLLVDFVPNHTSDRHPWFVEARSSRDSPKRDWYIWRDEPNNWRAAFTKGSAWTYDADTRQYYLHFFLPAQPDLNWSNPAVVEAMHDVLRFWLDRGVDGFRVDVAHCVGKDPAFEDDPRSFGGEPISSFNDQPYSHEVLRGIRKLVDSYPGDRVIVGEVNIRVPATVVRYYGADDELHLSFNFPPLDAPWDPIVWRSVIGEVEKHLLPAGAWPTWVLSNHDNARHRTRFGGSLRRARAAAVMLLTLRGTPFIYQGEELGLEDAKVEPDKRVDPGGRDGARAPIPWTPDYPHEWSGQEPWLPFPPDAHRHNAQTERENAASTANFYRRLIALRQGSAALRCGTWEPLDLAHEVVAYRRRDGRDERLVLVNFRADENKVDIAGDWRVAVASDSVGEGEAFAGTIAGEQALVLRPEQEARTTAEA